MPSVLVQAALRLKNLLLPGIGWPCLARSGLAERTPLFYWGLGDGRGRDRSGQEGIKQMQVGIEAVNKGEDLPESGRSSEIEVPG